MATILYSLGLQEGFLSLRWFLEGITGLIGFVYKVGVGIRAELGSGLQNPETPKP